MVSRYCNLFLPFYVFFGENLISEKIALQITSSKLTFFPSPWALVLVSFPYFCCCLGCIFAFCHPFIAFLFVKALCSLFSGCLRSLSSTFFYVIEGLCLLSSVLFCFFYARFKLFLVASFGITCVILLTGYLILGWTY